MIEGTFDDFGGNTQIYENSIKLKIWFYNPGEPGHMHNVLIPRHLELNSNRDIATYIAKQLGFPVNDQYAYGLMLPLVDISAGDNLDQLTNDSMYELVQSKVTLKLHDLIDL